MLHLEEKTGNCDFPVTVTCDWKDFGNCESWDVAGDREKVKILYIMSMEQM